MKCNTSSQPTRPWATHLLRLGSFPIVDTVKGVASEFRRIERLRQVALAALEPGAGWPFARYWISFKARFHFSPLAGAIQGIRHEWRRVENLRRRILITHQDHV